MTARWPDKVDVAARQALPGAYATNAITLDNPARLAPRAYSGPGIGSLSPDAGPRIVRVHQACQRIAQIR